jgi:hypothetical protein
VEIVPSLAVGMAVVEGVQVRKRTNQGVESARNQITKLWTVGTYLMKTTKLRKGMLLLPHLHMAMTQIGIQIQGLQIMSRVS